jgi:hypothetical protein
MYFVAQIVFKSYVPYSLEKGMWFVRTSNEEKEIFELNQVFSSPEEEEKFITDNGYPVKPFIVEEYMDGSSPAILATPEQIGWFDEGEDTDELRDITLEEINYIINMDGGFLLVDIDGQTGEPILAEGKIIITIDFTDAEPWDGTLMDGLDPEDYDDYGITCDHCGSTNVFPNSSGQMICDNCGWEEDNECDV